MEDDKDIQRKDESTLINGSQNNTVGRFGVSNNQNDVNDIKSKLEKTRLDNISNNIPSNDVSNNVGMPSGNGLDPYQDGLDDESNSRGSSGGSGGNVLGNVINSVRKRTAKATNPVGNGPGEAIKEGLEGVTKSTEETVVKAGEGAAKAGGELLAKGGQAIANAGKAAIKAGGEAAKAGISAIGEGLAAFFATPVGWGAIIVAVVILLIVLITVIVAMVVNSLGMKFGLTGEETLEVFNEKFSEGMSRNELESIMADVDEESGAECKLDFFARIRDFFHINDLSNTCELVHYVKYVLEEEEKKVKPVSPGYMMASMYYAFDTQNTDEDGKPYIMPEDYNVVSSAEELGQINDLDAIATLMAANIYNSTTIWNLLDYYIFNESYTYYYWQPNEETEDPDDGTCEAGYSEDHNVDVDKLYLYLRYGKDVADAYEDDLNKKLAYQATSADCKDLLGFDLPDMSKYDAKADPDTTTNDYANVTIDSGIYGYNCGFIFNTYPRYRVEDTKEFVSYDYFIDKEIEHIIELIDSRQDYINYVLGYPNHVQTEVANRDDSSSVGRVCSYNLNGEELSNIKVRVLAEDGSPMEGVDLLNLEDYIAGVVYGEMSPVRYGGARRTPDELKAFAIMTRNVVLHIGLTNMKNEDGNIVIEIYGGTKNQIYCEPGKLCHTCSVGDFNYVYPSDTSMAQRGNCKHYASTGDLPEEDIEYMKNVISEVAGVTMLGENNDIYYVEYRSAQSVVGDPCSCDGIKNGTCVPKNHIAYETCLLAWGDEGLDYTEILKKAYPTDPFKLGTPNCKSTGVASGDWASWKQGDPQWSGLELNHSTLGKVGCLITSHAMMFAKNSSLLVIPDFNPGTYAKALMDNGCLVNGDNFSYDCGVRTAIGDKEYERITRSGSYDYLVGEIANLLNQGYEVILKVKDAAYDGTDHYVFVTGVEGNDIYIADPGRDCTVVLDVYNKRSVNWLTAYKFS